MMPWGTNSKPSNAYTAINDTDGAMSEKSSDGEGDGDNDAHLTKTYGLFDLLCVGVGATVGSGVFVLTGLVARDIAGPGVVLSWVIAGCACCLSATSFAELSSRFPSSTSSYTFVKHTLGEFPAYLAAWCLSLECGLSAAAVARSWGRKLVSLWSLAAATADGTSTMTATTDTWGFNLYACLLQLAAVLLFLAGKDVSKMVINVFTVAKVLLIVFMVVMGLSLFRVANFQPTLIPMGWDGILRGSTMCFFGFVGYDEVCCLALETKHARVLMPQAVFGTIALVCLLYGLSSVALVGMEHYTLIDRDNGYAMAFAQAGYPTISTITAVGEMVMLPLVVLLSFLPQPRILAALARDGLAPSILAQVNSNGNLVPAIVVSGFIAVVVASWIPFVILNDLISAGVLLSFNATNSALILVRCERPVVGPVVASSGSGGGCGGSTWQWSQCQVLLVVFHGLAILFALQLSHYNAAVVVNPDTAGGSPGFRHPHVHTRQEAVLLGTTTIMLMGSGLALAYLCPDRDHSPPPPSTPTAIIASPLPASTVTVTAPSSATIAAGGVATTPLPTPSMVASSSSSSSSSAHPHQVYRTPAVPFIPLLGICINTLLIFQLSTSGLYLFVAYFGLATVTYVIQRICRRFASPGPVVRPSVVHHTPLHAMEECELTALAPSATVTTTATTRTHSA